MLVISININEFKSLKKKKDFRKQNPVLCCIPEIHLKQSVSKRLKIKLNSNNKKAGFNNLNKQSKIQTKKKITEQHMDMLYNVKSHNSL